MDETKLRLAKAPASKDNLLCQRLAKVNIILWFQAVSIEESHLGLV
jgi:hypothetical protein